MVDINRATALSVEVSAMVEDMFQYHQWTAADIGVGGKVRVALIEAVRAIIENVPPCPDRSTAIRKIREARMDCNAAITHGGEY